MNDRLFNAIEKIDDDLVQGAAPAERNARTSTKQKTRTLRILPVAAIVAVLLTITALAVSGIGGWFLDFFRGQSTEELSPGQQQFIEEGAVGIGLSIKSGDLAVTVESALSDDYTALIKLKIEAPDGVALDEDNYAFHNSTFRLSEPGENQSEADVISASGAYYLLDDEDGKSNTITILFERSLRLLSGSDFTYRDGVARTLRLENFCTWTDEGEQLLYEGEWSFEFVLGDSGSGAVELVTELVKAQGEKGSDGEYEPVLVTSFEISPLGIVGRYEYVQTHEPYFYEALEFRGVEVVLKDGSIIYPSPSSGSVGGDGTGSFSLAFSAPIALEDVDFVRLPGGHCLSVQIEFSD